MIEMVNAFVAGFTQIFSMTTFSLMLLGILIGFAVGILPGLGGPSALALMLPFIVKMTPVEAFAFRPEAFSSRFSIYFTLKKC